jgi:rod shape determining protein RodA
MRNTPWHHFDFWLLGAVALLTIFGITMISSAIAGNIELIEANTVQKQIIFAVGGFIIALITAAIDYRLWASLSRFLYWGIIIILVILLSVGNQLFGSNRWFNLGPILIQPSELAKIVIILVMADFLTRNQEKIKNLGWVIRSFLLTLGIAIRPQHLDCNLRVVVCPFMGRWTRDQASPDRHWCRSISAGSRPAVIIDELRPCKYRRTDQALSD